MKHDTSPIDGQTLKQSDLIKLHFAKNDAGEYVDPVTFKVLTDNTHIVAIRHNDSANVFAYDTVERLNIKAKSWKDLVSDEEFSRKDIITLQDPQNLESRNLSAFKYVKDGEDTGIEQEQASINTSAMGNASDLKILKAKEAVAKARAERAAGQATVKKAGNQISNVHKPTIVKTKSTPYNATHHTTGQAAASLTSTGLTPHTSAALALMSDEEYLLRRGRVKQKGYARLSTTLGDINVELQPEYAPKAVWNFVRLAQKGYYNGIIFHRNIRHFMIQTGDPTGTGRGGSSVWGKPFDDELDNPLKHDTRGIISMANKGKNTNTSQFFITYRATSHLDKKHTIFGKVIDGMEVLKKLEETPVDSNDRPKEEIKILEILVFIDPFEEFWKQKREDEGLEKEQKRRQQDGDSEDKTTWTGKRIRADGTIQDDSHSVGKYLKTSTQKHSDEELVEILDDIDEPIRKKPKSGGFGDFSSW